MPGTATTILIDGTPTNGSDPWVDSLVWGGAWTDGDGGKVTITYSTPSVGYLEGEQSLNWTPQALVALGQALALWESVANIDFVEVESPFADALFWVGTQSQAGGPGILGWSEVPGYTDHEHLNVVFNGQDPSWSASSLAKGGYGFVTLVHEIGHLLGLAHPHDGGSAWDATTFPGVDAPFHDYGDDDLNQGIYTVMGYNSGWPAAYSPKSPNWGFEAGPMALDIAAIQAIYGANTSYASGNDVYALPTANGAGTSWSTIWDTGGVDTISGAGWSGDSSIDLRAATADSNGGGYVSHGYASWGEMILGGFTIARGVVIENAIGGSGNDTIIGNAAANRLEGGAGRDTLDGQSGADTMVGGSGNDAYYVENSGDVIIELDAWAETDIVYSVVNYELSAYVEHLTLTGTASINGTGNAGDNTIVGNSGDNILDGGGGTDYLYGGGGNDTYILRGNQAHAIELPGDGIDTIRTDWGGKLDANFENMELLAGAWSAEGNDSDNRIVGNDGPNTLDGGMGNDTLIGGLGNDFLDGGLGADTMMGGLGSDTYFVDNLLDVVIEEGDDIYDAWDEIFVEFTYSLIGLDKVERLNLSHAGTANIDATGNDLNNALYGSDGNNVLDGRGGADFMLGGGGNDTYIVDDVDDYVSEDADGGTDTVRSSATTYTLHDDVENLILTGSASISGFGNDLANVIEGNAGSNVLVGGLGADALSGGDDADYLLIDGSDTVIDGGAGFDSAFVQTAAAVTLDMGASSIEWVQGNAGNDVFNAASQSGAVYLYGMGGDDTLTGSAFGDYLDGGDGTDTLSGGDGADLMLGNGGSDILRGDGGDDSLIELGGDSVIDGGAGFDSLFVWSDTGVTLDLTAASIEWVQGSVPGDDHLDGAGNTVNTFLYGWGGNDVLRGGAGDDYIAGGAGDDVLTGGAGNDTMIGETGFDRYVYTNTVWGSDTIHSFDFNGEKLDFTAVAAIHSFSDFTTYEWDPLGLGYNSTTLFYTSGATTSAITLIGVQTASLSDADFLFA